MKLFELREHLRTSLWFVPTLCVTGAVVLAFVLIEVDRSGFESPYIFVGGADGARSFLSTLSSSMITFTGLVFTITIVVLQLASQQYSPRVLRSFLRDRHSQLALGIFTATFMYSLIVLREIRGEDSAGGGFVPSLAVTGAFLFVVGSLFLFVYYIHQITQSIRVGNITRSIGDETRDAIDHIYDQDEVPDALSPPRSRPTHVVTADSRGVLQGLNTGKMVRFAVEWDCLVEVVPSIGDFVPQGFPLIRVHGGPSSGVDGLLDSVNLGRERTTRQDAAFGFRQLADIGEKALSPSLNDPTTAVQCLDEMHDLLRRLGTRPFPTGQYLDNDGNLRLVHPVTSWEDYVHLAFDEIRSYGKDSLQIHRRMRSAINDLLDVVPPARQPPLRTQLELLDASAQRNIDDPEDRTSARGVDAQGVGDF